VDIVRIMGRRDRENVPPRCRGVVRRVDSRRAHPPRRLTRPARRQAGARCRSRPSGADPAVEAAATWRDYAKATRQTIAKAMASLGVEADGA